MTSTMSSGAAGDAPRPALGIRGSWIVAAAALFAYAPIVALRYDFFDSWSLLYVVSATRYYNFAIGCLESYEVSYLIGRPLYPAAICAATIFGPVADLLWVPKLLAFAAWLGTAGIFAAELRRAGAGAVLAGLCALSILFLPGPLLIVAQLATLPIAFGALPGAAAGYLWVLGWRRPRQTRRGRAALLAAVVALLVVSMALYQIVAVTFFVPILIVLLFAPMPDGRRALRLALWSAAVFGAAAILYLGAHYWLLYGHRYFFLKPEWVAGISSTTRSATLHFGLGHFVEKLRYLGDLLPDIATMWFVSEWWRVSLPAAALVAAALAAAGALLAFGRAGGRWRFAAVAVVCAAFFAPYLVSDTKGDLYYSQQRIRVFFQIPVAVILWWLIHLLVQQRRAWATAAVAASGAAIFAGAVVSYLLVMRADVIPNYMELKRVEPALEEAVRRDIRQIYLIGPYRERLRAVLGRAVNLEYASVTTAHVPLHMMMAILTALEKKRPQRATIPVPAEKGDTIAPGPGRMIIDMRDFP